VCCVALTRPNSLIVRAVMCCAAVLDALCCDMLCRDMPCRDMSCRDMLCCAVSTSSALSAPRLSSELDLIHEKKVIVFVNTKRQCDNVYAQLESAGYSCTVLHGGRSQDQREVRLGSRVAGRNAEGNV
jgi:hypothetical protein